MKVALAGRKDSIHISHFGRADFFRIYELAQGRQELLDVRFNEAPCDGWTHDAGRLEQSVELIGDCDGVVASAIGPGAISILVQHRIFPFEHEGAGSEGIVKALGAIRERLGRVRVLPLINKSESQELTQHG